MNPIRIIVLVLLALLSSCEHFTQPDPGIGEAIEYSALPGWDNDQHAEAFSTFLVGCRKLERKENWKKLCQTARDSFGSDDTSAKEFFETYFKPHPLIGEKGKTEGMITGYYEPLLHGSMQADERYRYPLYRPPDDMLIVELSSLFPALKNKRVRGRVVGNEVIPYYSREEIEGDDQPLKGQELLWVDDRDQLFFLQIQGSGRIELPDGRIIGAGYANQNGHAYISIGKKLIEMGELKREDVSLFSIKAWLKSNPEIAKALLNENPSYVFFTLRDQIDEGPTGSLNVPLTAGRSMAIDPKFVEMGSPIWLSTTYPGVEKQKLQKLLFAQDTGGAIKGQVRADIFWGAGERAELLAGNMKQLGEMYILLPKLNLE